MLVLNSLSQLLTLWIKRSGQISHFGDFLKDRSYAEKSRARGEALLAEAILAADEGFQRVAALLEA